MYDIAHDYYVGLLQQASLSRDATAMIEAQNALSQRTSQYNADVALENSNYEALKAQIIANCK